MKKTAILFPGQGSQYVGMGKQIYDNFEIARHTFEEANEVLQFDLQSLCFGGDLAELTKTEITQPAILTCSVTAFRVYMQEIGLAPSCLAGHSLGEISALTCAGGIAFEDAVQLVHYRGKCMQDSVKESIGCMSAVSGVSAEVIEDYCQQVSEPGSVVKISNFNAADQVVISGHIDAVAKVENMLKGLGAIAIRLKVSGAFHNPLMKEASLLFNQALGKYDYSPLRYPVISNVTARPYETERLIPHYLTMQITEPVRWQASMHYLQQLGVEVAIEMTPKAVLTRLMATNAPSIATYAFDNENVENVKGIVTRKQPKTNAISQCLAIAVSTRNQNWDQAEYRAGVIEPYQKVQSIQDELDQTVQAPSTEQMAEALDMLMSVFRTKRVSEAEQHMRIQQLLDQTDAAHPFFALLTNQLGAIPL
ncbi:ACP S-malonyltransferase [Paenibacillus sp. PR3]|uniref:[acyl-carrier-protein] S-malonyltransferase n=1 Tax=Paenibacillus terricola TaxID=2763503 RepID=A0ABR8MX91_9BACL|nr:ACP S-malonyltransferase [Paenibacillus terricola]MBD3919139.1 ACP S-malonyltransferase [Paenibacillus terricola]